MLVVDVGAVVCGWVIELGDEPVSSSELSGLAMNSPGATPRRRAPCGRRGGAGVEGPGWVCSERRGGGCPLGPVMLAMAGSTAAATAMAMVGAQQWRRRQVREVCI